MYIINIVFYILKIVKYFIYWIVDYMQYSVILHENLKWHITVQTNNYSHQ